MENELSFVWRVILLVQHSSKPMSYRHARERLKYADNRTGNCLGPFICADQIELM
jgi:hypothetical protein